ncbi:hypothetical protein Gohar_002731, partial [Gossypium harknessii]|nr:hypothetical protein [Gossypium harknessii]
MTIGNFAKTFADINLDDGNQDSVPVDYDNEKVEEVRTKVCSSGTSKQVMSMEVEGFDDDFLRSVFDYLVGYESEAKTFLVE